MMKTTTFLCIVAFAIVSSVPTAAFPMSFRQHRQQGRRLLGLHKQLQQQHQQQHQQVKQVQQQQQHQQAEQQQQYQGQLGTFNLVWPSARQAGEQVGEQTQFAHKGSPFPGHWGQPPRAQRRDLVGWPAQFGKGSSTVRDWIRQNMVDDGAAATAQHDGAAAATAHHEQQLESESEHDRKEPPPSPPASAPARPPASPPPPTTTTTVQPGPLRQPDGSVEAGDLVAVGDVHGSLSNLFTTLHKNKIVDQAGDWAGGTRKVVQTGDLLGRGPDDKEVIEYVQRLQSQATAAGGEWVQLMGNHEWMELHRDYTYANDGPGGVGYGSTEARDHEFQTGAHGAWLRGLPAMHVWNDVVFVHGGLSSPTMASLGTVILNKHVAGYVAGAHSDTRVANELLWSRVLAENDEAEVCPLLTAVLQELGNGVTKMVVGHTITATTGEFAPGELGSRCGGALQMVDVGLSSAFKTIPKLWRAAHFHEAKNDARAIPVEVATATDELSSAAGHHLRTVAQWNTAGVLQQQQKQQPGKTAQPKMVAVVEAAVERDHVAVVEAAVERGHVAVAGAGASSPMPAAPARATDAVAEATEAAAPAQLTEAAAPAQLSTPLTPEEDGWELEAMAEAIAAPRIGADGKDRTAPSYRLDSGSGRKDVVHADPDTDLPPPLGM